MVSTFSTKHVRERGVRGLRRLRRARRRRRFGERIAGLPPGHLLQRAPADSLMQQLSSIDGGVVWTRVPAGVYTISAQHPTTASRPSPHVRARPRRQREPALGPARAGRHRARGHHRPLEQPELRRLRVANLPKKGGKVQVRCAGKGCPFHVKRAVRSARLRRGRGADRRRLGAWLQQPRRPLEGGVGEALAALHPARSDAPAQALLPAAPAPSADRYRCFPER